MTIPTSSRTPTEIEIGREFDAIADMWHNHLMFHAHIVKYQIIYATNNMQIKIWHITDGAQTVDVYLDDRLTANYSYSSTMARDVMLYFVER